MKKNYINKGALAGKIAGYSALSAAFIATNADAQIVYTDIVDINVAVNDTGEFDLAAISLNNDTIADVGVLVQASFNSTYGVQVNTAVGLVATGGGAMGYYNSNYGTLGAALDDSADIDANQLFIESTNTSSSGASFLMGVAIPIAPSNNVGAWPGVDMKHLGVRFNIDGNAHYGWVRMSCSDSANFVIHDYAYNSVTGEAILAGDTAKEDSVIISIDELSADMVNVYTHGNVINFNVKDVEFIGSVATVYDLNGRELVSTFLNEHSTIQMNVAEGMYLVQIRKDGKGYNEKVYISAQ